MITRFTRRIRDRRFTCGYEHGASYVDVPLNGVKGDVFVARVSDFNGKPSTDLPRAELLKYSNRDARMNGIKAGPEFSGCCSMGKFRQAESEHQSFKV